MYLRNFKGAVDRITCDCVSCDAPCEKACVLTGSKEPVAIRNLMIRMKQQAHVLPDHKIEETDLSTDLCGVRLENPFLLSSSVVSSSYEMCRNAFEAGWAGAVFKTICSFPTTQMRRTWRSAPQRNRRHRELDRRAGVPASRRGKYRRRPSEHRTGYDPFPGLQSRPLHWLRPMLHFLQGRRPSGDRI